MTARDATGETSDQLAADEAAGVIVAPATPADPRLSITAALRQAFKANEQAFLAPTDTRHLHGWLYSGPAVKPKVLWKSTLKPRKDHDSPDWLTATEFEDVPAVMDAKAVQLAALLRLSRHTVVYSGAGISASAVGQAALSGVNKTGWLDKTSAKPTMTHHALALLARAGWVHGWVQQNHDGLPQKAGFPQERICEVHGSWYDPSNPVVKYSGSLKDHEAEWMERETEAADLVLVLGTSLGGLYADQVATRCAERALGATSGGPRLGSALINLQQTEQDGKMSLKVSGRSDDVLVRVLAELGLADQLPREPKHNARFTAKTCALVPYDESGMRLPLSSNQPKMWLDLSAGASVKLIAHGPAKHNHQGARQPNTIHIGSKKGQKFQGKPLASAGSCPGHGTVVRREDESSSVILQVEGAKCRLGTWWLEAAERGGPAMLPLVNHAPVFEGAPDPSAARASARAARGVEAPGSKASSKAVGKTDVKAGTGAGDRWKGTAAVGGAVRGAVAGTRKMPVASVLAAS